MTRIRHALALRLRRFRDWRGRRHHHRRVGVKRLGSFGEGSLIFAPAALTNPQRMHIGSGVRIMHRSFIGAFTEHNGRTYDPEIRSGDRTVIGKDAHITAIGSIRIGSDGLIGDRVLIQDTYHDYRDPDTPIIHQRLVDPEPVTIGDGVFIGHSVVIMRGVTVGRNAYLTTNTVVTKDVPDNAVVAGIPGRILRQWDGKQWIVPERAPESPWLEGP